MGASGGGGVTALALFDALQDFGSRPLAAAMAVPAQPVEFVAPPPSVEDIVRERVEQAEAALRERLAEQHAAEIETLRREHAVQLDEALRRIGATAGETIALRLAEIEDRVSHQASAATARILGSFLSEEMLKRSIAGLADAIRSSLAGRETFSIDIRGPQQLCSALRDALGAGEWDRAGSFNHHEAPDFDLSVAIAGNLLETRLSEWSATLSGILE
jgi:hypothetical protein